MTRTKMISAGQLFCLLFVNRMVVNITYSPFMAATGEMLDHALSAVLAMVFTLVMIVPVYLLYLRRPACSLMDNVWELFGKFLGILFTVIYCAYFLFICSYTLSVYNTFMTSVMSPVFSSLLMSAAVLIAGCYGAFRGIEALARASGIIIIIILGCVVFLVSALLPQIDSLNYTPLLYEGTEKMLNGAKQMISRTVCIPFIGMLLPITKGKLKTSLATWIASIYLVMIILIVVTVGALGDFVKTQIFPIYSAASTAELGIFKRVDILFLAVWTTGLFIKISLSLYVFSLCIKRALGEKAARISILAGAFLVFLGTLWTVNQKNSLYNIYQFDIMFWFTVTASVGIPVLLLIVDLIKNRRAKE